MSFRRFEGDMIVETWDSWDALSVLQSEAGADLLDRLTFEL